jgi:TonB family protein
VRLVIDRAGVPTTVELVRSSGLAAFDAAVIEAIATFDLTRPMPLPTDEARLREVTGPGLVLEVFANAAVVPSTPTPSDSK